MGTWSDSHVTIGGLNLSQHDLDNDVRWGIDDIEGWGGTTAPTLSPKQRARASGAHAGDSFSAGRSVAITGWMKSPAADLLSLMEDRLNSAVSREPTLMTIVHKGRSRWAMVRRSGAVLWKEISPTFATWSIQVFSKDWRKFHAPLVGTTRLPSSSGGLQIPYTVPYSINAVVNAGQINLVNPGNESGPVLMRVDGPAAGPVITHVGSKQALVFSSSLVLAAGEWLDIDMETHKVLANGQASRNGYITSRGWSAFEPGPNTWSLTAAAFDAATLLTVTATPADE